MRPSSSPTSSFACSYSGLSSISPGWKASRIRSAASFRRSRTVSSSCFRRSSPSGVSSTGSVRSIPLPRANNNRMSEALREGDALLIVDPQVDFCPGGSLAVPHGDRIFEAVNRAAGMAPVVIASRDWHPPDHISFRAQGGIWPVHCVRDTPGAGFHPELDQSRIDKVVSKATARSEEAYSAFAGTDLEEYLRSRGVKRLLVGGLATDYCVRQSVLDARKAGFEVVVLEDAIGAVEVNPGDGERALAEMRAAGAEVATARELARA